MSSEAHNPPIGIIAGNGLLPCEVAQALHKRGHEAFVLGIAGECSDAIQQFDHHIIEWGQLGLLRRLLEERGVGFRSLTENIDTTTPSGRLVFHIFGASGQFERDLIR